MPQGLPRKIKVAFILQAFVASIAITVGIVIAGWAIREHLMQQHLDVGRARAAHATVTRSGSTSP